MARLYSEQEQQAPVQAEPQLRQEGLIVDGPDGDSNAAVMTEYFIQRPGIVVTIDAIRAAVYGPLRNSLIWTEASTARFRFQDVFATLSADEQDNFRSWIRPQRLIDSDKNNTAILEYLKKSQQQGRIIKQSINHDTLLKAAMYGIPRQLDWAPEPEQPKGFNELRKHQDDGKGLHDPNPLHRAGKLNHAEIERQEAAKKAAERQSAPQESDPWNSSERIFKAECERLLNHGFHSQQAAFRELYDRRGSKSWRQLFGEMETLKKSYERTFNPRAI